MGLAEEQDAQQQTKIPAQNIRELDTHTEVPDHPHTNMFIGFAQDYWWVIVIFVVGLLFSAKAIWRISLKIPFVNEILKMWKKT